MRILSGVSFCFLKPVLAAVVFIISALPVRSQLTEKNYRIYSVKENREATLKDIALSMRSHDVLFFGEEHNDSVTHYLQSGMLEELFAEFGTKTVLSMEMFDRDVQHVMDEYLNNLIREKHFVKDARAWSNYRDYKPMVEFAKSNKLHVICANAPTRYTNMAGRKGQNALMELPSKTKGYFAPLPYDTAAGPYYEKLMGLSHAPAPATGSDSLTKTAPPPVMMMGNFNMILAQSLWDATMAYSIAEHLKQHKDVKIMQVNGRFHSDEGFAAVTQLKKYRPRVRTLIVSSTSDDKFPEIDWSQYKHLGDYIIITDPAVPRTYKD
jgi:uncharacterized iron-regulated protein